MSSPSDSTGSSSDSSRPDPEVPSFGKRLGRVIIGGPRSLQDKRLFHTLSLIPFLAWVGLGADGLSSSCYGPEEAFRTLGDQTYLALGLALMTAGTVFLIGMAYGRIIEEFPYGGGGYLVATKLLGQRSGIVSGCALLVDYVLTIAVSVASAGDALFSFLPVSWHPFKLGFVVMLVVGLTVLNIRGVRESVTVLLPIFLIFLVTHLVAIGGGILAHTDQLPALSQQVSTGFETGVRTLGIGALLMLLMHAYSMGGGTYTGLEAVSNGLPILREPRVHNARRTMIYMAISLAVTAGGLILCYLLWNVSYVPGKTMNAVLFETMTVGIPGGAAFVIVTLLAEGALLIVGAQAGFIDGPRVLGNLAVDSWMPRRFAALSERLTTQNGIFLMGVLAVVVLMYTGGDIRHLVIMYSINVFLTFSLSMLGMLRHSWTGRSTGRPWRRRTVLFLVGFILCSTILVMTMSLKFSEGGWVTLSVTGALVGLAFLIRAHYRTVWSKISKLYSQLEQALPAGEVAVGPVDPTKPTAAVLVAAYGGLGLHTTLNILRAFPGQFNNLIFVSVGVIDSATFKGEGSIEQLKEQTEAALKKYVALGRRLGMPSSYKMAIGMDAVDEADKLCQEVAQEFPRVTYFAGKIVFKRERWYQPLLHNETALALQTRLFWSGKTMVILPARVL